MTTSQRQLTTLGPLGADGLQSLRFEMRSLEPPDLECRTTRVLGLPLLVETARVPPSGEGWVDRFLGLPDEALALLRCRFHNLEPTPSR